MQIIRLTTLITLGLATPAMAAATVPEEYQGVWAAAQDCKQSFQNILAHVVNREHATCRVIQVISSVNQDGTRTPSTSIAGAREAVKSGTTKISTARISLSQCNLNVERKWPHRRSPYINGAPKYRLATFRLATFLGRTRGGSKAKAPNYNFTNDSRAIPRTRGSASVFGPVPATAALRTI